MIGQLNPHESKVAVIGGGISGLLAAYRLDLLGYEVSLYEAGSRLGGLISTHPLPHGIAESAAHSLLASSEVLRLFTELQVDFFPVRKGRHARFIAREGKLRRFPLSPIEATAAISRLLTRKSRSSDGESVLLSDWAHAFLGSAARDYLVAPFVTGVYGCQPQELDVRAAFPKLVVPEGQTLLAHLRNLRRAQTTRQRKPMKPMIALARGMGALVETLDQKIRARLGSRVYLNHRLTELPQKTNIVLCVPTAEASRILSTLDFDASRALQAVRYAPLVSSTVILRRDAHQAQEGVGFLVPPKENLPILGVLFNSSAFPGRVTDESQYASYTVMMGGTTSRQWIDASDAEIQRVIESQFRDVFGLKGLIEEIRISRWSQAVPIYGPEILAAWNALRKGWCEKAGHVFFGNASGQVSLRGMIEGIYKWDSPPASSRSK